MVAVFAPAVLLLNSTNASRPCIVGRYRYLLLLLEHFVTLVLQLGRELSIQDGLVQGNRNVGVVWFGLVWFK